MILNKKEGIKIEYIKSPLNYIGGKYKLLPQILPLFPKQINTFVDLFGGGFNVGINVKANNYIYNDALTQVKELLETIYTLNIGNLLSYIDFQIDKYQLTKTNQEGYLKLREEYNKNNKNPLLFYTLICYAFNNQIRFNSKGEYNMPFGKDKSSFNPTLREKFITFANAIEKIDVEFFNEDFQHIDFSKLNNNDLVYCDPPYLVTTATYNENGGWTELDERDLLIVLDNLNYKNIKFALSNVLESKGKSNNILKEWSTKYNIHYLNNTYSNCNYQKKDKGSRDLEVLITNY